ncbi:MAG: hypothetical protein WC966_06300 [Bradymonadales bacterium]|jgi:hypothetical protein
MRYLVFIGFSLMLLSCSVSTEENSLGRESGIILESENAQSFSFKLAKHYDCSEPERQKKQVRRE